MRDMQNPEQHKSFEGIRQLDLDGNEFWLARDLAPLLEYQEWRNFLRVIDKAKTACEQLGHASADHLGDVTRMVEIGSGAQRPIENLR